MNAQEKLAFAKLWLAKASESAGGWYGYDEDVTVETAKSMIETSVKWGCEPSVDLSAYGTHSYWVQSVERSEGVDTAEELVAELESLNYKF